MPEPAPDRFERFRTTYGLTDRSVLDEIEQDVIGAVYRANGYTTLEQARTLGSRLELGPDQLLLDLGTGCGWPALYLASTTGCRVVATDVPLEGLAHASTRARSDGIEHSTYVVASAAEDLPFRAGSFDAITHTDVLC